ncbi:hypothetical protein U1Q18_039047 [Sarracenia purpurea var. burkii]
MCNSEKVLIFVWLVAQDSAATKELQVPKANTQRSLWKMAYCWCSSHGGSIVLALMPFALVIEFWELTYYAASEHSWSPYTLHDETWSRQKYNHKLRRVTTRASSTATWTNSGLASFSSTASLTIDAPTVVLRRPLYSLPKVTDPIVPYIAAFAAIALPYPRSSPPLQFVDEENKAYIIPMN